MSGIVLVFPILADKVEAWRRFCQELAGSRRQLYEISRQRLGISREQFALVETTYGSTAVTTLEAPNAAQALEQIISSEFPFDMWYREQLLELHGINIFGYEQFVQLAQLPQNQEVHFEWNRRESDG